MTFPKIDFSEIEAPFFNPRAGRRQLDRATFRSADDTPKTWGVLPKPNQQHTEREHIHRVFFEDCEREGDPKDCALRRAITGRYVEPTTPTGIEAIVCDDIAKRQALGINKYGTTVADNPLSLREWLQHSYEECLDMAIYLKRSLQELKNKDEE